MINKEIILNADGSIKKDFVDRNIPQNSNNQVSVNVLIPSQCFTGLQNYAVLLAVSRIISNVETTLNTLVMSVAKSITIDGVVYVKYTAYLSSAYTDKIGQLKFSPYIQTTATITVGGTTSEVISIQQSFTNSNLNVIKSVLPQYDASMEEATTATTLASQIASKKIYTFIDDATSLGEHYYNLVDGFNPSVDQFKGCLVVSLMTLANIDNITYVMPYLEGDDVKLLEITKDGKFYKISNVSRDDLVNETYSYTRVALSYSKSEIDTLIYKKTETYNKAETDALLNEKVDKTQKVNGHALSGDITLTKGDVGLGNVANMSYETTPTTTGENLYITSKGVYDALQIIYGIINGMATEEQITTINGRLDSIEEIIGSDSGDSDSVINTLKEVIVVLNGLGEGANLLDLINAKANQSDFNALNAQINGTGGIADKVDDIYARTNAYMEIKNSVGTIDIAVSDWVANTGDNEYPYKWELTNGYLEGAVNCIVVYSKDSDTSMLSATTGIDEVNGKLVIYASEIPSATISIEKISVFNDLNAYINYSNEIVQQVLSNTSAISDINNVKLPQYLKSSRPHTSSGYNFVNKIERSADNLLFTSLTITASKTNTESYYDYQEGIMYITDEMISLVSQKSVDANNSILVNLKLKNSGLECKIDNKVSGATTTHTLTFDANGDLKVDGNAVGGGKQLYQHNIYMKTHPDLSNYPCSEILITITNTQSTPMDRGQIVDYLYDKGFLANESGYIQRSVFMKVNGTYINSASSCLDIYKIAISNDKTYFVLGKHNGTSNITTSNENVANYSYLTDTVIPL